MSDNKKQFDDTPDEAEKKEQPTSDGELQQNNTANLNKKIAVTEADDGKQQKVEGNADGDKVAGKGQQKEEEATTMAKDVDEEESVEIKPGEFVINAISAAFEHLVKEDEFREKQAEALLGGCLDLVCTYPEVCSHKNVYFSITH